MRLAGTLLLMLFACSSAVIGQTPVQNSASGQSASDYSGMYSFLREGEFVQLTVEDDGRITGFVSRFGDSDSDRGAFLDQFFKQAKLEGTRLTFTTDVIHGVWYEFKGSIARGEGKTLSEEAYYVLKGTLTDYRTDADKKVTSNSREVVFKSFPREK
jgi:hypothetical protein